MTRMPQGKRACCGVYVRVPHALGCKRTKVLFLDIDGVLNDNKTPIRFDVKNIPLHMDPVLVYRLNLIVDRVDCSLVLSSSWRIDKNWRQIMRANGIFGEFLDRTPDNRLLTSRGREIKQWLDEHPEVTRYAILDDNADMLDSQKPNFFKTSVLHGLTQEIADAVEAHLKI
jgi:hypothetical protein